MRRVTERVMKNIEVEVCDICESKDINIRFSWNYHCPFDDCTDESGDLSFCSLDHMQLGIDKLLDNITPDESFFSQGLRIDIESEGIADILNFLIRNKKDK